MPSLNDYIENKDGQGSSTKRIGEIAILADVPKGEPGFIPEGTPKQRSTYGLRVQCWTDEMTKGGGIPAEDLPYCFLKSSRTTGTGKGIAYQIPAVGTKVVMERVNDDYGWMITGEIMSTKHGLARYHKDWPNSYGG